MFGSGWVGTGLCPAPWRVYERERKKGELSDGGRGVAIGLDKQDLWQISTAGSSGWWPVGSSPINSTRSIHHVDGSSHGQCNTGRFITKTVIFCNRLQYTAFSTVADTRWLLLGKCLCGRYQENVQANLKSLKKIKKCTKCAKLRSSYSNSYQKLFLSFRTTTGEP